MNAALAANINDMMSAGDTLIHCGDWSFKGLEQAKIFREMLRPGINVILISGNHDRHKMKHNEFRRLFNNIHDIYNLTLYKQKMVFCHYAMKVWLHSQHGSWLLYGHSHGSLPDDPNSLSFDCGVDCHNYKPLTFENVRDIMSRKTFVPVDHHK